MNESKEMGTSTWDMWSRSDDFSFLRDSSLFSSSLPVLPHEKLNVRDHGPGYSLTEDASSSSKKVHTDVKQSDSFDKVENRAIGNMLPDNEDELFAGILNGLDYGALPYHVDDLEEFDIFGSGGGLEIESDPKEGLGFGVSRLILSDSVTGNVMAHFAGQNSAGNVTGEHPLGEHPSRTLFVRNINSNVEDSELRDLFQEYGDIRSLYTACKHRGFVMISYYDIRAARTALRALQNKPLRRRKLDIHFSIPKDNPSDKDLNQGTLVVLNLDPSVSNEELLQIFGAYGEVKEIRETPHKRHHKFIEYFDVRAAEAALRSLNRRDIAGKRIKLELSRPGGSRRNLVLHPGQDPETDEPPSFHHSVVASFGNSPPGNWPQFGSPLKQAPLSSLSKSPDFRSLSPTIGNASGLASSFQPRTSPTDLDFLRSNAADNFLNNGNSGYRNATQQSLSFPESNSSQFSGSASSFGASNSNGSGVETYSGPQFLWGSPMYSEPTNSSSWRGQSFGHPLAPNERTHGFSFSNHGHYLGPLQGHHTHHHHVGSAPSGVPFEKHVGFYHDPLEAFMSRTQGTLDFRHNDKSLKMNLGARSNDPSLIDRSFKMNLAARSNDPSSLSVFENVSPGFSMMPSSRLSPLFFGNDHYPGMAANSLEGFHDRSRTRRVENNGNQMDSKKSFELDLEKIKSGEDSRTTLMIKNIPNKYTSNMLLAAIDENNKGTYDFLYLPIDFKNRCNVGYAFINLRSPSHIIPFYEAFNGRKWEKFNSEKVASLAYARIQGKTALVSHFENSSLMNEDKRCRPILFQSEGSESGDQVIHEYFTSCSNFQVRRSNGLDTREPPSGSPKDNEGLEQ